MNVSSHILKLSGKAELPNEIDVGSNYRVSLEGSIISMTESDNENGTYTRTYTFRPVKIDLLDPKGKMLKLKDPRQKSQLFRGRVWSIWKDAPTPQTFDDFYDHLMSNLITHAPELVAMYGKDR